MHRHLVVLASEPRADDGRELAEIRRWLAEQPRHALWGCTPATRVAYLLRELDRLRSAIDAIKLVET